MVELLKQPQYQPLRTLRAGDLDLRRHPGRARRHARSRGVLPFEAATARARARRVPGDPRRRWRSTGDLPARRIGRRSCSSVAASQLVNGASHVADGVAPSSRPRTTHGQPPSPRQAPQVDPQHPQDHADDAADRHGALPDGLQPRRGRAAVHREARRAGRPIWRAPAAALDHPLLKTRNPAAPAAVLVRDQQPRPLRRLQRATSCAPPLGASRSARRAARRPRSTVFGKKGIAYFRFLKRPIDRSRRRRSSDTPRFEQVEPVADALIDALPGRRDLGGPRRLHALPLGRHAAARGRSSSCRWPPTAAPAGQAAPGATAVEYEFRPEPGALLDELLPAVGRASGSSRPSSTPRSPSRSPAWWR